MTSHSSKCHAVIYNMVASKEPTLSTKIIFLQKFLSAKLKKTARAAVRRATVKQQLQIVQGYEGDLQLVTISCFVVAFCIL